MITVLITSASRKVSLVKAFKEALKKEGGGKVIATENNPFSPALFFADAHYLLPKDSEKNFLGEVISICKKNKVNLIVPTRDEELVVFAKNKEKLHKEGVTVAVSPALSIAICQDKLKFFEFCQSNHIASPHVYNREDAKEGKLPYPLFINGRVSKASKNAFLVHNKKELEAYLAIIEKPVIQEYLQGKEYTVDVFSDFEGNVVSIVPRERIKIFGGESFVSKTFNHKQLITESLRLAKALQLIGHSTIQCFFDGKKVVFIEVNPRYGGAANLGFAAGANTPRFMVKLLKGKKLSPKIGMFKDNLVMLRYTEDFFIDEKKLI